MKYLFKLIVASSFLVTSGTFLIVNAESRNDVDISDGLLSKQMQDVRVAVIGSGIGGSSATYYLRKLLGPSAHIDVYEKSDRIGGRLDVITLNGQTVEAGGVVIHDINKYMVDFTKQLDLDHNKVMDSFRLGIYDGKDFVFSESKYNWLNSLKMIWRYGLFSLWKMDSSLKKMMKDFTNIYTLQDEGNSYKTVPEMLEAMGGKTFVEYAQKSCKKVMLEQGIGERFIDELVTAVSRMSYGQDADTINGFTGYVSMAGGQDGELWNVKGGNYQVCQGLLKQSAVEVHEKTKITGIRKKLDKNTSKTVYYLEGAEMDSIPYDAVIVAAPLEVPSSFLTCNECQHWPDQSKLGTYQKTIASFVQATVNFKKFGFQTAKEMPEVVLTTENRSLNFSTLEPLRDLKGEVTDPPVYKVFSRKELSKETIEDLFEKPSSGYSEYSAISWLAYPHYAPPERFLRFELDDGVFYINSIERAASAMEMSAISGRNGAILTFNYLKNRMQSKTMNSILLQ